MLSEKIEFTYKKSNPLPWHQIFNSIPRYQKGFYQLQIPTCVRGLQQRKNCEEPVICYSFRASSQHFGLVLGRLCKVNTRRELAATNLYKSLQ